MKDNDLVVWVLVLICAMFVLTVGEPDIIDGLIDKSNKPGKFSGPRKDYE